MLQQPIPGSHVWRAPEQAGGDKVGSCRENTSFALSPRGKRLTSSALPSAPKNWEVFHYKIS